MGGPAYQPNWEEVCSGEEEFNQELYSVEEDPEENSNLASSLSPNRPGRRTCWRWWHSFAFCERDGG